FGPVEPGLAFNTAASFTTIPAMFAGTFPVLMALNIMRLGTPESAILSAVIHNFFRKGNLSTLRELALRAVADEVGEKAATYREREGLEPALIPERVMVCMSSSADAPRVLRTGARIAGRLGARWYAVYVVTPRSAPGHIN